MPWARFVLIWSALVVAIATPIAFAATSPQLEWRHPLYIAGGFAGIIALGLLLVQPLLIGGLLPLSPRRSRHAHRWIGGLLVLAVVSHVGALWGTSPPDVVDALLFRSPTPFAAWGVVAMWATFAAALLAVFRRRVSPRTWRLGHTILVAIIVVGSAAHALLIEGTMETVTKAMLCTLVVVSAVKAVAGQLK